MKTIPFITKATALRIINNLPDGTKVTNLKVQHHNGTTLLQEVYEGLKGILPRDPAECQWREDSLDNDRSDSSTRPVCIAVVAGEESGWDLCIQRHEQDGTPLEKVQVVNVQDTTDPRTWEFSQVENMLLRVGVRVDIAEQDRSNFHGVEVFQDVPAL